VEEGTRQIVGRLLARRPRLQMAVGPYKEITNFLNICSNKTPVFKCQVNIIRRRMHIGFWRKSQKEWHH
jgi:hypothetical protein